MHIQYICMNMSFTECDTEIYPPKQLEVTDMKDLQDQRKPSMSDTMYNMVHKTDLFIFACGHHLKHGGEKPNEKA